MFMSRKLVSALMITALPLLTYAADIKVDNNTDIYGTGHFNSFLKICSSTLGDKGIMKPGQQDFTISGSSINTACGSKDCEAFVYATSNCSGKRVATVVLNSKTGIVNITNEATDRFKIKYTATHVEINPAETGGFKNWFKSLF